MGCRHHFRFFSLSCHFQRHELKSLPFNRFFYSVHSSFVTGRLSWNYINLNICVTAIERRVACVVSSVWITRIFWQNKISSYRFFPVVEGKTWNINVFVVCLILQKFIKVFQILTNPSLLLRLSSLAWVGSRMLILALVRGLLWRRVYAVKLGSSLTEVF